MNENELVTKFWESHENCLFNQKTVALILGYSTKWLERCRWEKTGLPYVKFDRNCFYRKKDIMDWIEKNTIYPES